MAISMLKIRRPLGRLIFNMGIAIPGKTAFLLRRPPVSQTIKHSEYIFCWSDDIFQNVVRSAKKYSARSQKRKSNVTIWCGFVVASGHMSLPDAIPLTGITGKWLTHANQHAPAPGCQHTQDHYCSTIWVDYFTVCTWVPAHPGSLL